MLADNARERPWDGAETLAALRASGAEKAKREAEDKAQLDDKERVRVAQTEAARRAAEETARQQREAEARQRALEEQHAQDLEARRQQAANKLRPTPQVRRWPLIVGMVGVVALVALIAILTALPAPASLPKPTQTAASAQVSPTVSKPELPINTPELTSTPTRVPPTVDPSLGIGSMQVSDKDGMTLLYVPAGEFTMGSDDSKTTMKSRRIQCIWTPFGSIRQK